MHVSRGGWLGQTYALAKFDDSFEGKKSGIRRSKEERKGMVETFIKRYQNSNNGDFPSLNLTRKEVGGSFYTVREIVREIIQENRVLGPPKSSPQDKNMENLDSFLEDHPLGTISVDHHVHLVPPNNTQTPLEHESINEEKDLNTMSIHESEKVVNGSRNKIERNGESYDPDLLVDEQIIYVERNQISGDDVIENNQSQKHQLLEEMHLFTGEKDSNSSSIHETDGSMNEVERNEEANTDMLVAENHKSDEQIIQKHQVFEDNLDEKSSETEVMVVGGFKEKDRTEKNKVDEMHSLNKSKSEEEMADQPPESNPTLIHPSTEEKTVNGADAHRKQSSISVQDDERSANLKRSGATLNRLNLESWEAASKKSHGHETHKLVTFIKAFITAFVKFWS